MKKWKWEVKSFVFPRDLKWRAQTSKVRGQHNGRLTRMGNEVAARSQEEKDKEIRHGYPELAQKSKVKSKGRKVAGARA